MSSQPVFDSHPTGGARAGRVDWKDDEVTSEILSAAIEIHKVLGPGLYEKTYKLCLAHELILRGLKLQAEVPFNIECKGLVVEEAYRVDILVEEQAIVEVKSTLEMHPVYEAQLLTYLRVSNIHRGLVLNFGLPLLKDGIIRRML